MTAKQLQSSHVITDVFIGMKDGLLIPSMLLIVLLATQIDRDHLVLICLIFITGNAMLHGIGFYLSATKTVSPVPPENLTITDKREELKVQHHSMKRFLANLDIPESIQEQAWEDHQAETKRWNDQMNHHAVVIEQGKKSTHAGLSAVTVALSYIVGGLIPVAALYAFPTNGLLSIGLTCVFFTLVIEMIHALYTETNWVLRIGQSSLVTIGLLSFTWLLARYFIPLLT
jgi:vacuolar iron transporter family protein